MVAATANDGLPGVIVGDNAKLSNEAGSTHSTADMISTDGEFDERLPLDEDDIERAAEQVVDEWSDRLQGVGDVYNEVGDKETPNELGVMNNELPAGGYEEVVMGYDDTENAELIEEEYVDEEYYSEEEIIESDDDDQILGVTERPLPDENLYGGSADGEPQQHLDTESTEAKVSDNGAVADGENILSGSPSQSGENLEYNEDEPYDYVEQTIRDDDLGDELGGQILEQEQDHQPIIPPPECTSADSPIENEPERQQMDDSQCFPQQQEMCVDNPEANTASEDTNIALEDSALSDLKKPEYDDAAANDQIHSTEETALGEGASTVESPDDNSAPDDNDKTEQLGGDCNDHEQRFEDFEPKSDPHDNVSLGHPTADNTSLEHCADETEDVKSLEQSLDGNKLLEHSMGMDDNKSVGNEAEDKPAAPIHKNGMITSYGSLVIHEDVFGHESFDANISVVPESHAEMEQSKVQREECSGEVPDVIGPTDEGGMETNSDIEAGGNTTPVQKPKKKTEKLFDLDADDDDDDDDDGFFFCVVLLACVCLVPVILAVTLPLALRRRKKAEPTLMPTVSSSLTAISRSNRFLFRLRPQ